MTLMPSTNLVMNGFATDSSTRRHCTTLLHAAASVISFLLGLTVASCDREPTQSSSMAPAPSLLPSALATTRQSARLLLRITSADTDTLVEISDPAHPAVVLQTVKASDRERVLHDLFRAYGDVRLELATERDIPHGAMITLMSDLRQSGFTQLQFAVRAP